MPYGENYSNYYIENFQEYNDSSFDENKNMDMSYSLMSDNSNDQNDEIREFAFSIKSKVVNQKIEALESYMNRNSSDEPVSFNRDIYF